MIDKITPITFIKNSKKRRHINIATYECLRICSKWTGISEERIRYFLSFHGRNRVYNMKICFYINQPDCPYCTVEFSDGSARHFLSKKEFNQFFYAAMDKFKQSQY